VCQCCIVACVKFKCTAHWQLHMEEAIGAFALFFLACYSPVRT